MFTRYDRFGWYGCGNSEADWREEMSILAEGPRWTLAEARRLYEEDVRNGRFEDDALQGVSGPASDGDGTVRGVPEDDPVGLPGASDGDTGAVPVGVSDRLRGESEAPAERGRKG